MAAPPARALVDYDHLIKLLLIGDSGVGKTCLLSRFSDGSFPTIGTLSRTIELDGMTIKLQIRDAVGQDRFRTNTTSDYHGAMGILLVYDVSNESSFDNIRNWICNIEQHASDNVNKILVGNKADMDESEIAVPNAKGQALADEYGIKFFETSAKTNLNVEEAFFSIAKDIKQRLTDNDARAEMDTGGLAARLETFSSAESDGQAIAKVCAERGWIWLTEGKLQCYFCGNGQHYPPNPKVDRELLDSSHTPLCDWKKTCCPETLVGASIPVQRARRGYNRFTDVENRAIIEGYKMHGSDWTKIKRDFSLELANRTTRDIKDRHRNIVGRSAATTVGGTGRQHGSHVSRKSSARALDGSTTSYHDAWATFVATGRQDTIRVIFHHEASLVAPITTNFPSVEKDVDVVKSLVRSKVKLLKEGAELRLLHELNSKIERIITTSEQLENMSWVRVEECLEGEETGGIEMAIFGYHCEIAQSGLKTLSYLGDPFVLYIHKGETLLQIKKKFESKYGVSDEEISKWKFACITTSARYLMDSEVLHSFWKPGAELRVEHPSL